MLLEATKFYYVYRANIFMRLTQLLTMGEVNKENVDTMGCNT